MKLTRLYTYAIVASLAMLSSCINDDSSYGGQVLPELSVKNANADEMIVANFNLGEQCTISPEIQYSGSAENLQYEWSVGTYNNQVKGELEVVGHDRDFSYFFNEGGMYYVHLAVTDGVVGIVQEYQVNINRTFENGFILVSNDESGKGNLAFIKVMTPEEIAEGMEQVRMENCLTRMNEGLGEEKLINVAIATLTWPKMITRLLAITEDKCYFLDPNAFTIIAEIKFSDTYPGFKATDFYPAYNPYVYDQNMKKFIHFDTNYMFGYEFGDYKGYAFDYIYNYAYVMWGSTNYNSYYITHNPETISMYDAYYSYYGTLPFTSSEDIFNGHEILAAFPSDEMDMSIYAFHNYAITRSLETNQLYFHEFDINNGFKVSQTSEITSSGQIAVPTKDMPFAISAKYHRWYYSTGNSIYVYLATNNTIMPSIEEYALQFPANETITFMSVPNDEELYVATYDSSTKRGNFYIYSLADVRTDNPNAAPKESFKSCADKITNIISKGSIAN